MANPMTPSELQWKPGPVPPPTEQFAVVLVWKNGWDTKDMIGDKVRLAPSFRTILASNISGFDELKWCFETEETFDDEDDPAQCDWYAYVGAYDTPASDEP